MTMYDVVWHAEISLYCIVKMRCVPINMREFSAYCFMRLHLNLTASRLRMRKRAATHLCTYGSPTNWFGTAFVFINEYNSSVNMLHWHRFPNLIHGVINGASTASLLTPCLSRYQLRSLSTMAAAPSAATKPSTTSESIPLPPSPDFSRVRMSNLFIPTQKEVPQDAVVSSHILLTRAGFIRQAASGVYNLLPLAQRTLEKIEAVIDKEMQSIGGQKLRLPSLTCPELWKKSGRWQSAGPEVCVCVCVFVFVFVFVGMNINTVVCVYVCVPTMAISCFYSHAVAAISTRRSSWFRFVSRPNM